MKRVIALVLMALMLPCHRSQAPIPIGLAVALKCVAFGTIGATAVIIYRCEPDYYLCCRQLDGEDPEWFASQATAKTLAKTGARRWEGPWKDRREPDFRAWVNNQSFAMGQPPMYPMGPLGTIPGPVRTNYMIITAQQTYNGGKLWRDAGRVAVEPGESNWSICLLSPTGTAGFNADELEAIAECDVVIPNGVALPGDIKDYDVRGFETELVGRTGRTGTTATPFQQSL